MALHARILAIIGLAAVVAAPAAAQTPSSAGRLATPAQPSPGQVSGLRYLTWNGKRPDPTRSPAPAIAAVQREAPVPPAATVYGPPVPAERPRNGLTPASAWLPAGAPAAPAAPVTASPPVLAPETPEAAAAARPADAPRPDAPIFRLAAAGVAPAPAAPAQPQAPAAPQAPVAGESPRFYSVHRAAGRTPDPVALPAPVMLDQAPVDLAEPEGPPLVLRDARGRLVPAEVLDGSTLP